MLGSNATGVDGFVDNCGGAASVDDKVSSSNCRVLHGGRKIFDDLKRFTLSNLALEIEIEEQFFKVGFFSKYFLSRRRRRKRSGIKRGGVSS